MRERLEVDKLDYEKIASTGCVECNEEIGKNIIFADWVVCDLVKDHFKGLCLKHFIVWSNEMEKGQHGIFGKFQTIMIFRPAKLLFDLQPHTEHTKKNIKSLR